MVIELAQIRRGNQTESIHFGHLCLINSDLQVDTFGSDFFSCYTRSIIKPLQAKISLDILGDSLSNQDLAIASSSHLATDESLDLVKNLLSKFHNTEESLLCGTNTESGKSLSSRLHHNCSGKHSLMLATCKKQAWSVDNYDHIDHPIQQLILAEIKRLTNINHIETAIDGCGLPTFYLSLEQMALCFLNLIKDKDYKRIINAMNQFPFASGGFKQIDSLLMHHYPNRFLAKGGAEGLMMVANLKSFEVLIIKIIDGSSRAKSCITRSILEQLNWIEHDSIPLDSNIYNSNKTTVGIIHTNKFI